MKVILSNHLQAKALTTRLAANPELLQEYLAVNQISEEEMETSAEKQLELLAWLKSSTADETAPVPGRMKVRLVQNYYTTVWNAAGTIMDFPAETAQRLIEGGTAVAYTED